MLRWTAPMPQTMRITGRFSDADSGGGDGVDVSIVKDGTTTLFSGTVANGDTSGVNFDLTPVAVVIGSTIDFIVAPRTGNAFDTTFIDPIIAPVTTGTPSTPGIGIGGGTIGIGAGVGIGQ